MTRRVTLGLLASLCLTTAVAAQQRSYVLEQVRVPHGYYWREMYVPQVTSGPSAATWSPDGTELIYSMQGTLWRQRIGDPVAEQLTDGPGYDFQPDWSPDGRWVAYTTYDGRSLALRVLDLRTGATHALLDDGAVNVEPRWSPDGGRLAFVSSSFEGRWHVYVADVTRPPDESAPTLAAPVRVTEDHDSALPRYYYSAYDHYLSPTWSPDGRELIVVSNRDHIYGTGGLWRIDARPGGGARELHFEETTWKARPDWARDGKRVVYSGYHGGQWHHLSLLPAAGGDPIQLTYGDFDATAPRWSPDGRRIAYIANEGGNTALWVLTIPGGERTRIQPMTRRYASPVSRLVVSVVDSTTGAMIPARVSVMTADGRYVVPDDAWRHADEALVREEQRFEVGYFHTAGRDSLVVSPGRAVIDVWHGPEFGHVREVVTLEPKARREVRVALPRLADLRAQGWMGGDLHVHMNYGGAYRNTPARLALQGRAEGLHVIENLIVNKEQRIPDIAYWRPDPDPASTPELLIAHGQEYHTGFWGHVGLLGLTSHYLLPDYADYPGTAAASLFPTNGTIAALAHRQGALVGYVHPLEILPDPSRLQSGVPYELPAAAALGAMDYIEVMGYSDHLLTSEIWYRLLNCGYRIPAGAGTDAFANFAAQRGPVGLVRVYARVGAAGDTPAATHRRFLDAIAAGRTFVTNAPLLSLSVDGHEPGDSIVRPAGRHRLTIRVSLRSAVPVDHLELVSNGTVVAAIPVHDGGTRADTAITLTVDRSGWLVLRARGDRPRLPVLDLYPFASTSPVYVRVGRAPVRSRADAEYFLAWLARAEDAARRHTGWNDDAERQNVLGMLRAAREEFAKRR